MVKQNIKEPIITACGNDCSVCPRYTAKTEEELQKVANFWYKIGWRDEIVTTEEITCNGCTIHNKCRYQIVPCLQDHNIENCNRCKEYPCNRINDMLETSNQFEKDCQACCTEEQFSILKQAFFEKKENLDKEKNSTIDDFYPVKIKSVASELDAELIMNLFKNNNIVSYKKSKGIGGYMNLYMGYSIYGEDIFVFQKDYDKAAQLLKELSLEPEFLGEDEEEDYQTPFYRNSKIIARIILIVMIGTIILSYLLNSNKITSMFQ